MRTFVLLQRSNNKHTNVMTHYIAHHEDPEEETETEIVIEDDNDAEVDRYDYESYPHEPPY